MTQMMPPCRVYDDYYPVPNDLYIPPDAFAILLQQFEGPLDFLIYLVRKNGLDLKNLDIAPIASQYLQYMQHMKAQDIELTADYLVMAALLADLKSRLLLPSALALAHEDDPRKQLLERLENYLELKQAAEQLGQSKVLERDVFAISVAKSHHVNVNLVYEVHLLQYALAQLTQRTHISMHHIQSESVSLTDCIDRVLHRLKDGQVHAFYHLLDPHEGQIGIIVTFMAVLELIRQQHVIIIHDGSEQPLRLQQFTAPSLFEHGS